MRGTHAGIAHALLMSANPNPRGSKHRGKNQPTYRKTKTKTGDHSALVGMHYMEYLTASLEEIKQVQRTIQ